jgi:hypothetical protein
MGFKEQLIEDSTAYIEKCAGDAAAYFKGKGIKHDFFGGTAMELSKENYKKIYEGMIEEIVDEKKQFVCKYGFFACLVPVMNEGKLMLTLSLGIAFRNSD